jgi:hypothetical protein
MKMTKMLGVLLVLVMTSLSYGSLATYQLTVDGAAPVDSPSAHTAVNVAQGSTVKVSVYFKTDFAISSNLALLGFDRSTAAGPGVATTDNKLTGGLASNLNPNFPSSQANYLAGGKAASATSGDRPYGLYFGGTKASGDSSKTYPDWTKLGDVVITNANLTTGSYTVALWDYPGTSTAYETHVAPWTGTPLPTLSILNDVVVTAPEPISMALLALGGGLGLLRRRQS